MLNKYVYLIFFRASFAAGIAAVRRERRKRGKMAARDDILEVEIPSFHFWERNEFISNSITMLVIFVF